MRRWSNWRDLFNYNKMKTFVCREGLFTGKIDSQCSCEIRQLNSRWRVDQPTVTGGSLAQALWWLLYFIYAANSTLNIFFSSFLTFFVL